MWTRSWFLFTITWTRSLNPNIVFFFSSVPSLLHSCITANLSRGAAQRSDRRRISHKCKLSVKLHFPATLRSSQITERLKQHERGDDVRRWVSVCVCVTCLLHVLLQGSWPWTWRRRTLCQWSSGPGRTRHNKYKVFNPLSQDDIYVYDVFIL